MEREEVSGQESSITFEEARRFVLETEPQGVLRLFSLVEPLRALGIRLLSYQAIPVCRPWYQHVRFIELECWVVPVRQVPRLLRPLVHFEGGLPCEIKINGYDDNGLYSIFPYHGLI